MSQRTVQLFVNPAAGSVSRRNVRALVRELETAGAHVLQSDSTGTSLAVAEGADLVCIVGGDGTLRHVAPAVARAGRPLIAAIYPAGTVNLLARECGYQRDPAAFARRLLGEGRRRHHAAHIGATPMFTCASAGPDSMAVAALSLPLKRWFGRLAYVLAFLRILICWQRPALRVTHDAGQYDCEAVYVAKGRFFAGPWSFAPHATVEEPLLHVVALRRARRRDFLAFVWKLARRGDLAGSPNVISFRCSALDIEGDPAFPLQADGDIVARLPVRIEMDAEPLTFV